MKKLILFILFPAMILHAQCWDKIACGYYHSAAIKGDGTLWAWGNNEEGQLGIGTDWNIDGGEANRNLPTQIETNGKWVSVSCGWDHTAAIKDDGTLWIWGGNQKGQLGDGTTISKNVPVQIGFDTDWNSVTCGQYLTLAIKNNGTLWTWGNNNIGQLGLNNNQNQNSPQQIGNDTWQTVATGLIFTVGIKSDGTLWAWGRNNIGQLGDGTTENKTQPVQIGEFTNWVSISAGESHSLGITSDGKLWSWGGNTEGELGTGNTTDSFVPVQAGLATNWIKCEAGRYYSFAMKSTGQLYKFGSGLTSPSLFNAQTDWNDVKTDSFHTLFLKNDGVLNAIGYNYFGEIGNGTNENSINLSEVICSNLGISQGFQYTLSCYPVPTKDYIYFDVPNNFQISLVEIIDISGKVILKQNKNITELSLKDITSGIYIIKAIINNSIHYFKIIKE